MRTHCHRVRTRGATATGTVRDGGRRLSADRALTAEQVMERAHEVCDRFYADGLTLGDVFDVLMAAVGIWSEDLEREGNQGAVHASVVTQPNALRMAAYVLRGCADDFEERRGIN